MEDLPRLEEMDRARRCAEDSRGGEEVSHLRTVIREMQKRIDLLETELEGMRRPALPRLRAVSGQRGEP